MTVITKHFVVDGHSYALVREPCWGKLQYGTVPRELIDSTGRLTRRLNGMEMCVAETIADAMEKRRIEVAVSEWRKKHPLATNEQISEMVNRWAEKGK